MLKPKSSQQSRSLNRRSLKARKNAPKREKTCYFERAKMKRDAMRIAKKPKQDKNLCQQQ